MNNRNSEIIICKNIKLDKSYTNVLDYSEQEMVNLCRDKAVASSNSYSFIKQGMNIIDTKFSYEQGLQCNYLAFQNPSYSNKWFFAFIDEVEYISNGCARIHYTIDEHSTWFSYWQTKSCFVIREHVTNDTVGLHTVSENLETGEYVVRYKQNSKYNDDGYYVCLGVTKLLLQGNISPNTQYNGVFSGLMYIIADSIRDSALLIQQYANKGLLDNIVNVFYVPKHNVNITSGGWIALEDYPTASWAMIASSENPTVFDTLQFHRAIELEDSYEPHNKKLLSYPFCYIQADNNVGGTAIYKYEYFNYDVLENASIGIYGVINPGCSIKAVPIDYKNVSLNFNESLTCGKLPICSWSGDTYTNYMTQQSINNAVKIGTIIADFATEEYEKGILNTASFVSEVYQKQLTPYQVSGNTNSTDIVFSLGEVGLSLYHMCIRKEFAIICDDYFTKYGYKINNLKIPNITGRRYFNYVQIGSDDDIGYSTVDTYSVPASSMDIINNIYRKGVTVWHEHVHVGNYDVDNDLH